MESLRNAHFLSDQDCDEALEESSQAGIRRSSLQAGKDSATTRSRNSNTVPQSESVQISHRSSSSQSGSFTPSLRPSMSSSSNAPASPSPLRSKYSKSSEIDGEGSSDSLGSRYTTDSQISSGLPRSQSFHNIQGNEGWRRRSNRRPSHPRQILRQNSARAFQRGYISRPGYPRQIRDLGHDFSRYPSSADLSIDNGRYAPVAEDSIPLLRATTNDQPDNAQINLERWPDDRLGSFDPYSGGDNGFIMYPNEEEADDKFHFPADDDDVTFRPKLKDYLDRRNVVSTCGAMFLILGLLCIFIVLPFLTYQTRLLLPERDRAIYSKDSAWNVNHNKYRLLKGFRKGLIDPDTPEIARTRKSTLDGSTLELVFSDEFNEDGRTFYEGDDPYWYAPNFWYGATQDLEWYDPDAVTTANGTLQLKLERFRNHDLDFRSGMLHSWNHLCFKGGVIEISVSLAGPAGIPGLWPGAWTMG